MCRDHHRDLHLFGNDVAFRIWAELELLVLFSQTTVTDPGAVAVPGKTGVLIK
jgi:hypothetical protein